MKLVSIVASLLVAISTQAMACEDHAKNTTAQQTSSQAPALSATAQLNTAIQISQPRIRAVAEAQKVTGAFMVLSNTSDKALDLVAAASAIANVTELHETTMQANGVMKMQKIETMTIPAKGTLALKPGSYHIMLINLNQTLEKGKAYPIQLSFSDGSTQTVNATVMDITH
ncbi:copper chaperone PCu(A)C [Thiolinea disciformis]|uniref:copper chaperone PCu(A)C n=1 Tax=Thiolinea disciformis TaxID=125614 RepID=UPI00037E37A2|nr:copper chaperone PCu(A)C [Thiolinea disciformis]